MPSAVVSTVLKALRFDRMISVKGRGLNAAAMTPLDAATLLAGIATGAATADVSKVTKMLLNMPERHRLVTGSSLAALQPNPLNNLMRGHRFAEGFAALLQETLQPEKQEEREEDGHVYQQEEFTINPLTDRSRVIIGLNGRKSAGISIIEAVKGNNRHKIFYSTYDLRDGRSEEEDYSDIGLALLKYAPAFLTATIVTGRALIEIAQAIATQQSPKS